MSFGALPPQYAPTPLPQGRRQAGMAGSIARALGEIPQHRARQQQYGNQRDAYVQMAAERLRSIGSPEALRFSEILAENPEGATAFVEQYGGWQAVESGLRAAAAAGTAQGLATALGGDKTAAGLLAQYGAETQNLGALDRALGASIQQRGQNMASGDRAQDRVWRSREAMLDRNLRRELARIEAAADAAGSPMTLTQQAKVVEVLDARRQFENLLAANPKWQKPEKMRAIITRAQGMTLDTALDQFAMGGAAGDERYAAALYKIGAQSLGFGDQQAYSDFRQLPLGDLPGRIQQQRDDARAERQRGATAEADAYDAGLR